MAFVTKEIIDEIKSKNDIVDVIGSYINLNEKYKALCPFHDDHTPSFSVHPDKQIYKCFSCGESGKRERRTFRRGNGADSRAESR